MAVSLRLARHGSKKHPYYRLVATRDRNRRDGRFLEHIGAYDPNLDPPAVLLKRDRVRYWLDQGAVASPTVTRLIAKYMEAEDVPIAREKAAPPAPIITPEAERAPARAAAPAPEEAEAATSEESETEAAPAEANAETAPEAAPGEANADEAQA